MVHIWSRCASEVKAVHRASGTRRRITLNTVQSTTERLYRKGLPEREKVSRAYVYGAKQSHEEFGARVVDEVATQVLRGETEPMLAAFVEVAARAGTGAPLR